MNPAMNLTSRQRKVLSELRGAGRVSEKNIYHLISQRTTGGHFNDYPSPLKQYQDFIRELRSDITKLTEKGYVLIDKNFSILRAREPETFSGLWHPQIHRASFFEMEIQGRRKYGSLEGIGGRVIDDFGRSFFWGAMSLDKVEFVIEHANKRILFAPKGDVYYAGFRETNEKFYKGDYEFVSNSNEKLEGSFYLAENIEDLPQI